MQTHVGIREAKINLTRYLKLVKSGNEVVLTEHGRPVGKIVPIEKKELSLDERIKRLEDDGVLERQTEGYRIPPPVPVPGHSAQQMLKDDREG
jgi:prevent-host-death family protein